MAARNVGNGACGRSSPIRSVGLGLLLGVQTLLAAETTNAPRSVAVSPSYVELLAASQAAAREGDSSQAMALAATALRRAPQRPEAHVIAAQLLGASGRSQAARQMASRAIDLAAPAQKVVIQKTLAQWLGKERATSAAMPPQPLPGSADTDWLISNPKKSAK